MRTVVRCRLITGLVLLAAMSGCARPAPRPRLVVLIAVDGLRADLLDRYDGAFHGGFRRLRDDGFRYDSAFVDHAITVSHAGHVTLATGCQPARHGIVDAAFYAPGPSGARVLVDAVRDTSESIPGDPGRTGVSPRHVLVSGISEWGAGAAAGARTLSVGSGYVSSLLYVFHSPAPVFWYQDGAYRTSSYYAGAVPDWVDRFNRERLPSLKDDWRTWTAAVPGSLATLSRPDSAAFENRGWCTTFPHRFEVQFGDAIARDRARALDRWLDWTPGLDAATLELAGEGVRELQLGQRDATDVLTIVLSTVDDMSHSYGPLSRETFETLWRIDDELGHFFDVLDRTVGKDRYVVALSSDHGFPEVPEYRKAEGLPGRRIEEPAIDSLLADVDAEIDRARGESADGIARRVADVVRRRDFVAGAYTAGELDSDEDTGDPYVRLYRHSFRPDRIPRLPLFSLETGESSIAAAGVMLRLREGAMIDLDVSIHGSPYPYDRHVPLVFMGAGVAPGRSVAEARTVDVAPTLAHLAGIPVPPDVDGRVLHFPGPKGRK